MLLSQPPLSSSLLLIRHAQTVLDPSAPADDWRLTPEAYRACRDLAKGLAGKGLSCIVSSETFKAKETARVLAEGLELPTMSAPNLHEHERVGTPFLSDDAFLSALQALFAYPDKLVFGSETAHSARERFDRAVRAALAQYPGETLAIVTHATVMSLFVAHYSAVDAFSYWQTLRMPDTVWLRLPSFELGPGHS